MIGEKSEIEAGQLKCGLLGGSVCHVDADVGGVVSPEILFVSELSASMLTPGYPYRPGAKSFGVHLILDGDFGGVDEFAK